MGRERLYKAGGGGDGDAIAGYGNKVDKPSTTIKTVNRKTKRERNNSSSGCMSAIFKFFDIQHHQFGFHHPTLIFESAINTPQHVNIGLQAPRNSLESPETAMDIAPSSSLVKEETNFNIPMGGIQIKTKRSGLSEDLYSEYSGSPSTKTPNLVARLMGLDLLPEYSCPRPSSSSSTPANSHHHSRSLPATPRISTASRRSTDRDYHHRLSLQIDKENCSSYKRQEPERETLQMKMARRRSDLLLDEHKSQYAKQIENQVRERIGRRLGTDITNTMSQSTMRNKEQRRDSNLVLLKPKNTTPSQLLTPAPAPGPAIKQKQEQEHTTPFSSSPKLRLLDIKSNLSKPTSNSQSSPFKEVVGQKPETQSVHQKPLTKQQKPAKDEKNHRIASARYELRMKKVPQQDDAFGGKICRKSTPLPSNVVNVKNTKKVRSFKKEMTSSSSITRLPQKQESLVSMTQLPSSLNSSYNQNDIRMLKISDQKSNAPTTSSSPNGGSSDHFDYILRILDLYRIQSTAIVSVGPWHSPSHPLHPSIFHKLEKLYHPTTTTTAAAARRRLMFELVDELLAEIMKPYTIQTSDLWGARTSDLFSKLCEKIESIPAADCVVLEDIEWLIERDMGESMRQLRATEFEAEAEEIVKEIESEIVETLMHEISTVKMAPAMSDTLRSFVSFT
ncbi:hypothetical protein LXL04_035308 [Taraxacum kok-saghyz]